MSHRWWLPLFLVEVGGALYGGLAWAILGVAKQLGAIVGMVLS
jgi:hypothetical protein